MLDLACIFTTGGVLLFYKTFCELGITNINEFIKQTILQDRVYESSCKIGGRLYKWVFDSELGIVFLFAYQELFQSLDFNSLLKLVSKNYVKNVYPDAIKNRDLYVYIPEFGKHFDKLLKSFNRKTKEKKAANRQQGKQINQPQAKGGNNAATSGGAGAQDEVEGVSEGDEEEDIQFKKLGESNEGNQGRTSSEEDKQSATSSEGERYEQAQKQGSPSKQKMTPKELAKLRMQKKKDNASKSNKKGSDNSPSKAGRSWGGLQKITDKNMDDLDVMKQIRKKKGLEDNSQQVAKVNKEFFEEGDDLDLDFELVSDDEEEDNKESNKKKSWILSSFKSSIKSFTGIGNLTEEQLTPVLDNFKNHLMNKNVAEEIARSIVDQLKMKLLNKKAELFTSISTTVKSSLKETLTNILTPKRKIDILTEAMESRERGEPYVITFIGVNGVGKSTNLAKVAYLFKSQGFSLMLAACDSFRAGAVKQLETHGNALGIPVFSQGNAQDPAKRAHAAIRDAKSKKIDVVLIDTAGRMQDNEPLMRELSRLVSLTSPKLIVFIGEALVGNDGVDQLTKFNDALIKYSTVGNERREIDAILVSKFDTVDEKVGAVLSMTHSTGKPVIFLGTGQKYPNLRKLDVDLVVNMLLS